MDDEFYKERARHIRELADKADPFIRKRLLDLAGNYDAIIRRSPRQTTLISSNLPKFPRDRPSGAREEGRRSSVILASVITRADAKYLEIMSPSSRTLRA
jgi:hypothetical protein